MSADNYVMVREFRDGWRWAIGFASDDRDRMGDSLTDSDFRNGPFPTAVDAQINAESDVGLIEYGIVRWDDDEQT